MVIYLKPATRLRVVVVLSVVLILLGIRGGLALQGEPIETAAKIVPIDRVNTSLPEVALVVDVTTGGPEQVNACLTALESIGAKATWFVTATFAESQEQAVKEIAVKGHEFGVKGTDEKPIDKLSQVEMKDRLQRSRQALLKAGIQAAPFLCPPGRRFSDALVTLAFQEGYQAIKPGIDLGRMKGKELEAGKKTADSLKVGDILVLRVDKKGIAPAEKYLAALSVSMKNQGMAVVTLSQLFKGVK